MESAIEDVIEYVSIKPQSTYCIYAAVLALIPDRKEMGHLDYSRCRAFHDPTNGVLKTVSTVASASFFVIIKIPRIYVAVRRLDDFGAPPQFSLKIRENKPMHLRFPIPFLLPYPDAVATLRPVIQARTTVMKKSTPVLMIGGIETFLDVSLSLSVKVISVHLRSCGRNRLIVADGVKWREVNTILFRLDIYIEYTYNQYI